MSYRNNQNNGRCHVVGKVYGLVMKGTYFVRTAKFLYETRNPDYWHAFNLLASQALEILPKSIIATDICLKENSKSIQFIRDTIYKELNSLGHRFDDIFERTPELKERLHILHIKRSNMSGFVDEFVFTIKNEKGNKDVRIKNLEGIRYGAFARKEDYLVYYSKDVADFLSNVMEQTKNIQLDMINKFDHKFKIQP